MLTIDQHCQWTTYNNQQLIVAQANRVLGLTTTTSGVWNSKIQVRGVIKKFSAWPSSVQNNSISFL